MGKLKIILERRRVLPFVVSFFYLNKIKKSSSLSLVMERRRIKNLNLGSIHRSEKRERDKKSFCVLVYRE